MPRLVAQKCFVATKLMKATSSMKPSGSPEQSCSQSSMGRLDAQVTCPALSPRYTAHFSSQPMDPS